ncbi:cation diffusion facilitator family transporter [Herbaspirillum robiniae]|uniref:cation diffusion facilitator family transporter n=1 Tax=Herbaspirillum robiniae TaxID=2014887 RepID=UPI003D76D688
MTTQNYFDTKTEQGLLRLSIVTTSTLSVLGVTAGLMAGSLTIVFDSLYEMADAVMTLMALAVSNLVTASGAGKLKPSLARRFTMGFSHLEPMVVALNGFMLVCASGYALMLAAGSLLSGGRELELGYAIAYAAVFFCAQFGMALLILRRNREIGSALLAIDAKSWLMAAAMSFALLPAFGFGLLVQGTSWQWMEPYIDPAVLGVICLIILPLPIGSIRKAMSEILLVTPPELKRQVDEVARDVSARHGFTHYWSNVATVGRENQIELYFLAPAQAPARRLEEWDTLRAEIAAALGEDPYRWLSVSFTADPAWIPAFRDSVASASAARQKDCLN